MRREVGKWPHSRQLGVILETGELTSAVRLRGCKTILPRAVFHDDLISPPKGHIWKQLKGSKTKAKEDLCLKKNKPKLQSKCAISLLSLPGLLLGAKSLACSRSHPVFRDRNCTVFVFHKVRASHLTWEVIKASSHLARS